jgi:hypothetical protein
MSPPGGGRSYLLIVIGADVVWLPAVSVATAVSVCLPRGSAPLIQVTVPWQVAVEHVSVLVSEPSA